MRAGARKLGLGLLVLVAGCRGLLGFEEPIVEEPIELPEVGFATGSSLADEQTATLEVQLALSRPSDAAITVELAISGAATRGADFSAPDAVVFEPGETAKPIAISIEQDDVEEADEDIRLELASADGASLGAQASHVVTIASDILPRVSFAAAEVQLSEATGGDIVVVLDRASATEVTVEYMIAGGTATMDDHALAGGTLTFRPGQLLQPIDVDLVDDALDEDDETLVLVLGNPVGIVVGPPAQLTATLEDDDPAPSVRFVGLSTSFGETTANRQIQVTLSAPSAKPITVEFTIAGSAQANQDYMQMTSPPLVFAPGDTSLPIAFRILADSFIEDPDDTIDYALVNPVNATVGTPATHQVIIVDND